MANVYLVVAEYQHPYSKDVLGVFRSQTMADKMAAQKNQDNHSPHIQYSVEEALFFD